MSQETLSQTLMSFTPIKQIHSHFHAVHCYATDHTRGVPAHHFCSHSSSRNLRQCIVYDSDQPDARLIGIEYIIDRDTFARLPEDEKKYWHSHKAEVESGVLSLVTKTIVPDSVEDAAEKSVMKELYNTYGKTIHTWQFDLSPELPLGPPTLMMSFVSPTEKLSPHLGVDPVAMKRKAEERIKYLEPLAPHNQVLEGADAWSRTGKAVEFIPQEVDARGQTREEGIIKWKGKEPLHVETKSSTGGESSQHQHATTTHSPHASQHSQGAGAASQGSQKA